MMVLVAHLYPVKATLVESVEAATKAVAAEVLALLVAMLPERSEVTAVQVRLVRSQVAR